MQIRCSFCCWSGTTLLLGVILLRASAQAEIALPMSHINTLENIDSDGSGRMPTSLARDLERRSKRAALAVFRGKLIHVLRFEFEQPQVKA
jgi:hypothetical protein